MSKRQSVHYEPLNTQHGGLTVLPGSFVSIQRVEHRIYVDRKDDNNRHTVVTVVRGESDLGIIDDEWRCVGTTKDGERTLDVYAHKSDLPWITDKGKILAVIALIWIVGFAYWWHNPVQTDVHWNYDEYHQRTDSTGVQADSLEVE